MEKSKSDSTAKRGVGTPDVGTSTFSNNILVTGPAGVGKSRLAKSFKRPVIHLDDYRPTSSHHSFDNVPSTRDAVIEGSIHSSDKALLTWGITKVYIPMAPVEIFREANRLKYEAALRRKDWPKRWADFFLRQSKMSDGSYLRMLNNEVRWFKKRLSIPVELVPGKADSSKVRAWE